jgi:hypothetical protein
VQLPLAFTHALLIDCREASIACLAPGVDLPAENAMKNLDLR